MSGDVKTEAPVVDLDPDAVVVGALAACLEPLRAAIAAMREAWGPGADEMQADALMHRFAELVIDHAFPDSPEYDAALSVVAPGAPDGDADAAIDGDE